MPEIMGQDAYLNIYPEATWGTKPGSPAYLHVPVTSFGVRMRPERRTVDPMSGLLPKKYGRNHRGYPSGPIAMSAWSYVRATKSITQTIIDWAFASNMTNPNDKAMPAYGLEWAEGPDVSNKQINGVRINQVTFGGSEDASGLDITLDCAGKSTGTFTTAQALPTDLEMYSMMEFEETVITLGGATVLPTAFQIVQRNGLKPKYFNSRSLTRLNRTMREIDVNITLSPTDDTWDAVRRTADGTDHNYACTIKCRGLHNGSGATGTYAFVLFTFPWLSYVDHENTLARGDEKLSPLTFQAFKPDTTEDVVTITYGLE